MKSGYSVDERIALKLLVVLARTMQGLQKRLSPTLRAGGLTPPQFGVLEMLYHIGPQTANAVIQKTLSTSGNITVVVDNLVKAGYATKQVAAEDRRKRVIAITEKGRRLMQAIFPAHLGALMDATEILNSAEKEQLTELLKKLGKSIENYE